MWSGPLTWPWNSKPPSDASALPKRCSTFCFACAMALGSLANPNRRLLQARFLDFVLQMGESKAICAVAGGFCVRDVRMRAGGEHVSEGRCQK